MTPQLTTQGSCEATKSTYSHTHMRTHRHTSRTVFLSFFFCPLLCDFLSMVLCVHVYALRCIMQKGCARGQQECEGCVPIETLSLTQHLLSAPTCCSGALSLCLSVCPTFCPHHLDDEGGLFYTSCVRDLF